MRVSRKAMLAAGLIAGAAVMTGCTANTKSAATPTPQAAQQATAQPATAEPQATASAEATMDTTMEAGSEESPAPIDLLVGGKEVSAGAAMEQSMLLLPLAETAEALGWASDSRQMEEETQTKRVITLDKDESRITVSWTVSDNTAKQITWQKDGLLIPVDTKITTISDVVYVPSAFFEEAMDARVNRTQTGVSVELPEPRNTPKTQEQSLGENG